MMVSKFGVSFSRGLFSGAFAVSFREGIPLQRLSPFLYGHYASPKLTQKQQDRHLYTGLAVKIWRKKTVFQTSSIFWLARLVGNEGPSTFTGWYIGDETSLIPYESGQLVFRLAKKKIPHFLLLDLERKSLFVPKKIP